MKNRIYSSFFILYSSFLALSHLNLNIHAAREAQTLEAFHRLEGRFGEIDQASVRAHFKLIACVFVDERRAVHGELADVGREGDRPVHERAAALRGFQNFRGGFVQDRVIESTQADPDDGELWSCVFLGFPLFFRSTSLLFGSGLGSYGRLFCFACRP